MLRRRAGRGETSRVPMRTLNAISQRMVDELNAAPDVVMSDEAIRARCGGRGAPLP